MQKNVQQKSTKKFRKKQKTIGEKIKDFTARSNNPNLKPNQRSYAQTRVKNLKNKKNRYSVIVLPDSIVFGSKNKAKKHNYVVLSNNGDNVVVAQVTHSPNVSQKYSLKNFDGKSKIKPKKYKKGINKKPITYLTGYETNNPKNKLSKNDKKMIDQNLK